MAISLNDLVKAAQAALTDHAFSLCITTLGSKGASSVAANFLQDSTVRMMVADPATAIQRTADGKGLTVSPATGVDIPFAGLACALHLFLTDDPNDPVGFEFHGSPTVDWSLGMAIPMFAGDTLPSLPFTASSADVPAITLQSNAAGGDASRPVGMSFDVVLDLKMASASISSLLGLTNPHLCGTFDIRDQGTRLWDFKLAIANPVPVNLVIATVDLSVALGMKLVYDPPNQRFSAIPALYFTADFPFTSGGEQHTLPLEAEILGFDDPITCTVDLTGLVSAALEDLEELIPLQGGGLDIKSLLPTEVASTLIDTVNPTTLTFVIDPTAKNKLTSVKLIMQPTASWPLFSGLTATINQLVVTALDPMGCGGAPYVSLEGSFALGNQGVIHVLASTAGGFSVQGYLDETSPLALGEIPGFPDGTGTVLGSLAVDTLRFTYDSTIGYSFDILLSDAWPINLGDVAQVEIEGIQVSIDATVEPTAITLAGRFTVAGFPMLLDASRGSDGVWALVGSTTDSLPLGQVLGWLQLLLPFEFPLPIDGITLGGLTATLRDGAGATTIGLSTTLVSDADNWADLGVFVTKGASATAWTYALTAKLDKSLDLGNLDVIGELLSGDALTAAQVTCASGALNTDELALLTELFPNGPVPVSGAGGGLSFSAAVTLDSTPYVIGRDLVVPAAAPPAAAPAPTVPAPGQGGYSAGPPPATDSTLWEVLDKDFGVAHLGRVGLRYRNDTLYLMLDAELSAGPILFGMDGLGIGLDIASLTPAFVLEGLEASFSSAGISLSGALIRLDDQYEGTLTVEAAGFTITAFGAYAAPGGTPSFFAYALLRDRPLGGPPFFFVLGLAGGLGYNRKLTLPTIDQVAEFPLIQAASVGDGGPLVKAGTDPLNVLKAFGKWISISPSDNWLAVGVTFSSFEMIQSTAVMTLTTGPKALLSLIGLSDLAIPTGAPNPIANAQVALLAMLDPEDGDLAVNGKLTPSSYVLSPDARLTGGFAFYVWMTTGDFVVTFGGYHPHFQKPASYPDVPRLQMNWQVNDNLSITANEYFALTPHAIMAGGSLSAVWNSGSLNAWFDVDANFLLLWKPFFYSIDASINIGASFEMDFLFFSVTVTIHVGVDLSIWGPPFGGTADVDLDIISFRVDFGSDQPNVPKLTLADFVTSFLPHPQATSTNADTSTAVLCSSHISSGLVKTIPPPPPSSTSHTTATEDVPMSCIINPQELGIVIRSAVPLLNVTFADPAGGLVDSYVGPDPTATLGIAPVGTTKGSWTSILHLTITKAGETTSSDLYHQLVFQAVRTAAPKALWGTVDAGDPTQSSTVLTGDQIVADVLYSVQVSALQNTPDFTQTVDLQTLLYAAADSFVLPLANPELLPPQSVPHQDVPTSIAAATDTRAAIVAAFQARGHGATLAPDKIDVTHIASGLGRLLATPIEQEIA